MSHRDEFNAPSNNGVVQKTNDEYYDSPQGPANQQTYYHSSADVNMLQQQSRQPVKSARFNNTPPRSPYQSVHHTSQSPSPQSNRPWSRGVYRHPQQGTARNTANGNHAYPPAPASNARGQPQSHHTQDHPQRRQNQSTRPQVRLPVPTGQSPAKSDPREHHLGNRNAASTPSRQQPHATDFAHSAHHSRKDHPKSVPQNIRRHRPSTSTSSKTSTGSNPWSTFTSPKTSTQPSSPASTQTAIPLDVKTASLSLDDPPTDEEWLLLRNETQPPRTIKDKFAQIHPLVRKYASYYHPEMKPGEPQWANAVQSRQWELEETLQRDKTELAKSLETGIPDSWPMTCMTESQERAYRLAMETLMLMRKYAGETDLEKNHVDELQTQDA